MSAASKIERLVIDTGVILDIMLATRPRHAQAKELGQFIIVNTVTIRVPMHCFFEIKAAAVLEMRQASERKQRVKGNESITETNPLNIEFVPIDMPFVNKYDDPSIPYLKASDLIFVAMAKGDNQILITEDNKQYKVAIAAGVQAYGIKEFLDLYVRK